MDMEDVMEDEVQLRYNRVEGPFLGWLLSRAYHGKTGLAHFGQGGYGFGVEDWQFQAGGEIYTFYGPPETQSHLATIGAEIHDLSDSQDGWLISEEENSLSALLMRRDFLDYYRRFSWSAYTAHNVGGILHMTVKYGRDDFESQANSVSWALHDTRFSRDDFRPNPAVVEGVVSSARVDVQLDTRNSRHNPWQGWFINGLFERAGGVLQGDHTFKRYVLDLRRYQPVSLGTRLDLRLRTGTAKENLPTQYLYDLGGISTLRGYRFKEFSGDRMALVNLEYWIDTDRHWHNHLPIDDLGVGVFFDVGSAWFANDASEPFEGVSESELKRSFGFGLGDKNQDFRFDLARPLDGDDESWHFLLRFGRSF
jgi:outer membrane protein assembly factor BamA